MNAFPKLALYLTIKNKEIDPPRVLDFMLKNPSLQIEERIQLVRELGTKHPVLGALLDALAAGAPMAPHERRQIDGFIRASWPEIMSEITQTADRIYALRDLPNKDFVPAVLYEAVPDFHDAYKRCFERLQFAVRSVRMSDDGTVLWLQLCNERGDALPFAFTSWEDVRLALHENFMLGWRSDAAEETFDATRYGSILDNAIAVLKDSVANAGFTFPKPKAEPAKNQEVQHEVDPTDPNRTFPPANEYQVLLPASWSSAYADGLGRMRDAVRGVRLTMNGYIGLPDGPDIFWATDWEGVRNSLHTIFNRGNHIGAEPIDGDSYMNVLENARGLIEEAVKRTKWVFPATPKPFHVPGEVDGETKHQERLASLTEAREEIALRHLAPIETLKHGVPVVELEALANAPSDVRKDMQDLAAAEAADTGAEADTVETGVVSLRIDEGGHERIVHLHPGDSLSLVAQDDRGLIVGKMVKIENLNKPKLK